jgi:hypothetical protein
MLKQTLIFLVLFPLVAAAQVSDDYFLTSDFEVREVTPQDLSGSSARPKINLSTSMRTASTGGSVGAGTCDPGVQTGLTRKTLTKSNSLQAAPSSAEAVMNHLPGLEQIDMVDVALDKVINIGKKIWTIVDAGKPVVNLSSDVATALPASNSNLPLCWTRLEKWQAPQSHVYLVSLKNVYGIEVIRLQYRVLFVAGGSLNGQGRYIGYAAIQPSDVSVAWGYDLQVQASAPAVFNMGTASSPVAGMNLEIKYTVKTPLKQTTASRAYFITGLGQFEKLD